ncbi:MAG: hypothetical protein DWQ04_10600 [Chloroflexi bacterium]|nr:MAG: hypothetical protein DWQ04_10600 [Chloroflexota bacterium]
MDYFNSDSGDLILYDTAKCNLFLCEVSNQSANMITVKITVIHEHDKVKINLSRLRQMIDKLFNESELKTLCFDLEVDYEKLPGSNKEDKVRELIGHFDRQEDIRRLVEYCRKQRPRSNWQTIYI